MVSLWKSLPTMMNAGDARTFRKDLAEFMKEMLMSVGHKHLLHKMLELQCCWNGFLRKYHYVLLPCNVYPQTSAIGLMKSCNGLKVVKKLHSFKAVLICSKTLENASIAPRNLHSPI